MMGTAPPSTLACQNRSYGVRISTTEATGVDTETAEDSGPNEVKAALAPAAPVGPESPRPGSRSKMTVARGSNPGAVTSLNAAAGEPTVVQFESTLARGAARGSSHTAHSPCVATRVAPGRGG